MHPEKKCNGNPLRWYSIVYLVQSPSGTKSMLGATIKSMHGSACVGQASLQTLRLLCRALDDVERRLCGAGISPAIVAASTLKLRRRIFDLHVVAHDQSDGRAPAEFAICPNIFTYATKAALIKIGALCNIGKAYITSNVYCGHLDLSDACQEARPEPTVAPRAGRPFFIRERKEEVHEPSVHSPSSSTSSTPHGGTPRHRTRHAGPRRHSRRRRTASPRTSSPVRRKRRS